METIFSANLTEFHSFILKLLNFAYIIFREFCDFWPFSLNYVPAYSFENHKIAKLNTCQLWNSLFPNIWSKYDIDTRISRVLRKANEIRYSVTYLITITLINNRKFDIQ